MDPNSEHVWAVLHNLGPSRLVQVDLKESQVVRELTDVGIKVQILCTNQLHPCSLVL